MLIMTQTLISTLFLMMIRPSPTPFYNPNEKTPQSTISRKPPAKRLKAPNRHCLQTLLQSNSPKTHYLHLSPEVGLKCEALAWDSSTM